MALLRRKSSRTRRTQEPSLEGALRRTELRHAVREERSDFFAVPNRYVVIPWRSSSHTGTGGDASRVIGPDLSALLINERRWLGIHGTRRYLRRCRRHLTSACRTPGNVTGDCAAGSCDGLGSVRSSV
jgi:hypothetical protein